MKDQPANGSVPAGATGALGLPVVVDRAAFQAELDRLRGREKAFTREGDAIAAARRRLPITEVDAILDRLPMGRDEGGQPMSWLRAGIPVPESVRRIQDSSG
jgi:predicted dithiol-disulfide oxidoreductase (DUF899 family)